MVDTLRDILNVLKDHGGRIRTLETLPRNASTTIISEGGAVEEGPGIDIPDGTSRVGVGEDSVLLVFNDQRPAEEYVFGSSGLDNAINSAGDGDQVRIQGVGTIPGNHTIAVDKELRGLGYQTVLSGTITVNEAGFAGGYASGVLADVRVTGSIAGNGFVNNVLVGDTPYEGTYITAAQRVSTVDPQQSSFIGGGWGHYMQNVFASAVQVGENVIGGGYGNQIFDGEDCAIFGGWGHVIETSAGYVHTSGVTICGGEGNYIIDSDDAFIGGGGIFHSIWQSEYAVIAGGDSHYIRGAPWAAILSGDSCYIDADPSLQYGLWTVICGGSDHYIDAVAGGGTSELWYNAIVGGDSHYEIDTTYAFIGGGGNNYITGVSTSGCEYNVIVGGYNHWLMDGDLGQDVSYSVIVGGGQNRLYDSDYSFIGGGSDNIIGDAASSTYVSDYSIIVGGIANQINDGVFSIIVGGDTNLISGDQTYNFIGGGVTNEITTVGDTVYYNVIVGGDTNVIQDGVGGSGGTACFIGGGYQNTMEDMTYGVIVGGYQNELIPGGGTGTCDFSFIGGGRQNIIYDGYWSVIVGGRINQIGDGTYDRTTIYAFIGGGYDNQIYESDYSVIVGGESNIVGAAATSEASEHAVIVGGETNTILSGPYGIIGGGLDHLIDTADYAGIFSGQANTITGDYASILGGYQGVADKYGQQTHSAGEFAADGDAQRSDFVARRSVTHSDANWYELYLDGTTNALLTIPADTVWTFVVLIAGTTQGCTKSFSFRIEGAIENDGGTTTILASTVTTIYDTDDVSFDARVSADDANDALLVEVQDSDGASDVVRWIASIRTAEVTFPA